jgi:hypothetical protein
MLFGALSSPWFGLWLPGMKLCCGVDERGTAFEKWTSSPRSVLTNARESCLVICESGANVVSCPSMVNQFVLMHALALTYYRVPSRWRRLQAAQACCGYQSLLEHTLPSVSTQAALMLPQRIHSLVEYRCATGCHISSEVAQTPLSAQQTEIE